MELMELKTAIVYFTGTRNTLRVAEMFKERLIKMGNKVDLIDITKYDNKLKNYDMFIIGSPTYSKVASRKIIEFIDRNIDNDLNKNKDFITFVTHSWEQAYGHISLRKHLEKRGFKVMVSQAFLMPNHFHMMMKEKNTEQEKKKMLEDTKNEVNILLKTYFSGDTLNDRKSNIKRVLHEQMYKILNKSWIPTFAHKYLEVDENKCTLCSACVRQCPSNNIEIKDGRISFKDKCLACGRCYNICPQNAYIVNNKHFEQSNL